MDSNALLWFAYLLGGCSALAVCEAWWIARKKARRENRKRRRIMRVMGGR